MIFPISCTIGQDCLLFETEPACKMFAALWIQGLLQGFLLAVLLQIGFAPKAS